MRTIIAMLAIAACISASAADTNAIPRIRLTDTGQSLVQRFGTNVVSQGMPEQFIIETFTNGNNWRIVCNMSKGKIGMIKYGHQPRLMTTAECRKIVSFYGLSFSGQEEGRSESGSIWVTWSRWGVIVSAKDRTP